MNEQTAPVTENPNIDQYQPQWGAWARQVVIVGLIIGIVYALTLLAPPAVSLQPPSTLSHLDE